MKCAYYPSSQPSDGRNHPRFDFQTPIRLRVVGSEHYFQGQTHDFSGGGICFVTQQEDLQPDMLLEVTILDQSNASGNEETLKSLVKIVRITAVPEQQQFEVCASIGHCNLSLENQKANQTIRLYHFMKYVNKKMNQLSQKNCDRRHYQRFCIANPIYLSVVGSGEAFRGQTNNLSANGICFTTQTSQLKPGMLLEMSIPHPHSISRKPALRSLIEITRILPSPEGLQISACMK